jgi:hypothetical protein
MKPAKTASRIRRSAARRPVQGYAIRLSGPLDRHEMEALKLEIRALAKRHRLVIDDITVRRPAAGGSA